MSDSGAVQLVAEDTVHMHNDFKTKNKSLMRSLRGNIDKYESGMMKERSTGSQRDFYNSKITEDSLTRVRRTVLTMSQH